jgi:hypothetical protein
VALGGLQLFASVFAICGAHAEWSCGDSSIKITNMLVARCK